MCGFKSIIKTTHTDGPFLPSNSDQPTTKMLLRPWIELPTPRHLLDENDDIDEKDAGFLLQYESWTEIEISSSLNTSPTLLLVAPKLSSYADSIPNSSLIGTLTSGYTKKPWLNKPAVTAASSNLLYDHELEVSSEASSETLHKADLKYIATPNGKDVVVLSVPLLEPRDCHAFSSKVLEKLKPGRIISLTPGNMVSTAESNLYGLYSQEIAQKDRTLPPLEPPFMISGAIASILSNCQRNAIPTISLVVKAEGPQGHEVVDYESTSYETSRALEGILGLSKNIIKPHNDHENSMYL